MKVLLRLLLIPKIKGIFLFTVKINKQRFLLKLLRNFRSRGGHKNKNGRNKTIKLVFATI